MLTMRRAVLGLMLLAIGLPAVGLSQGPLRRLLFGPKQTTVIRQSAPVMQTRTPVCVDGVCYTDGTTVSTPARIQIPRYEQPVPLIVGAPVPIAEPVVQTADRVDRAIADAPITEVESRSGFRRSLVKAARKAANSGTIKRKDAVRVRIACFSPAFLDAAEDLCVIQMAFSGDEAVEDLPRNVDGEIDRASIDWDGFASFLERIMPLVLQLIAAFGA